MMSDSDANQVDDRESGWVRVLLTAAWVFCLLLVLQDLRGAYEGRLIAISLVMLGPLCILAIVQGVVLRGWPRSLATWSLVIVILIVGLLAIALVFVISPKWFPVGVLWIIAIALLGLGILWWRGSMRNAVIACCLLLLAMIAALGANRGTWNGRIDRVPAGEFAVGSAMIWIAEEPDVFTVIGSDMADVWAPQDIVATVGGVETRERLANPLDWELIRQRHTDDALLVYLARDNETRTTEIHLRTISASGFGELEESLVAHRAQFPAFLHSLETNDHWRVFPRLIEPGDPLALSGITFRHKETGRNVHAESLNVRWVFATDDPDRFVAITLETEHDPREEDADEALLMWEVDLNEARDGRVEPRLLRRYVTPHATFGIIDAHPKSGAFLHVFTLSAGGGFGFRPQVEFLDWETGELTTVAQNIRTQDLRTRTGRGALFALVVEPHDSGPTLGAFRGREELGTTTLRPFDVLSDVAFSPMGDKAALLVERGFRPRAIGEALAIQLTIVWDIKRDTLTEVNAQSLEISMLGDVPFAEAMDWNRLQWSRDGRRLAHFTTGSRKFLFSRYEGGILIYHYEDWAEEKWGPRTTGGE